MILQQPETITVDIIDVAVADAGPAIAVGTGHGASVADKGTTPFLITPVTGDGKGDARAKRHDEQSN